MKILINLSLGIILFFSIAFFTTTNVPPVYAALCAGGSCLQKANENCQLGYTFVEVDAQVCAKTKTACCPITSATCQNKSCTTPQAGCAPGFVSISDQSCSFGFACCQDLSQNTNPGGPDGNTFSPVPQPIPPVVGGTGPAFDPPTQDDFDNLNPLLVFGDRLTGGNIGETLSTPGGIVSRLLVFLFPAAGLVLFVMLVWGGFEVLTGAAAKKQVDSGRQRITAAVIGFILLFASYWIMQIVEYIFGLVIF
jgi:hypothetical protein